MRRRLASMALDELQTISLIWKTVGARGRNKGVDPFSDDVSWLRGGRKKLVVFKSDMLVSSTDAPPQMTPKQIGSKAIVSCVSDFASKGARPVACLVSLAIPREKSNKQFLSALSRGFRQACMEYGVRLVGGDTNESKSEIIVDCSMLGFAEKIVYRRGARPGDLIGSTGYFGLQSCGLALLLDRKGKLAVPPGRFRLAATRTVLEPRARLKMGLAISGYASSSIDSSDGLALSLYELAEASKVDFGLDYIPIAQGVKDFAKRNSMIAEELALFGGEEYELLFTFSRKNEKRARRMGVVVLGSVTRKVAGRKSRVFLDSRIVPRKGFLHNQPR